MCEEKQPDRSELLQSIPLSPNQEILRHFLLGDYSFIVRTIKLLAALKYAEVKHWSNPIPTGRTGEYIAILTKREAPSASQES